MTIRSLVLATVAASLLLPQPAYAQRRYQPGEITVGEHVQADPFAMHKFQNCTVTGVNWTFDHSAIDTYTAKCNGIEYHIIADSDHIRRGGGGDTGTQHYAFAHKIYSQKAPPLSAAVTNGSLLTPGVYHCIAGFSTMITYGDFTISGTSFTFRAPDGSGGSGSYSVDPNGYLHWSGNFGVLSRPPWVIERSNKEPYVKDAISFYYHRQDGIRRSMSCRRV